MSQNYMHQQCSSQKWNEGGNSLGAQWLALGAFTAVGLGSVPGRGTKNPQAAWHGQKKKKEMQVDISQV